MSQSLDVWVPHVIQRLEITKLKQGNKVWGYSLKLYTYGQSGVYNLPLEVFPSRIIRVLNLTKLPTEHITKNSNGVYFVNNTIFEVFSNPDIYSHLFSFILLFGAERWQVTGKTESIRKGVSLVLNSIEVKGSRHTAKATIESDNKNSIDDFISAVRFGGNSVSTEYSRSGDIYKVTLTLSLLVFFRIVSKYNYLLCVPNTVSFFRKYKKVTETYALSTHKVGGLLLDSISLINATSGELVGERDLGLTGMGECDWGLMLENLRVRNCLAYIE